MYVSHVVLLSLLPSVNQIFILNAEGPEEENSVDQCTVSFTFIADTSYLSKVC